MENGTWIVVLIVVLLVGGLNLAMYGLVRSAFNGESKSALDMLGKTLNAAQKKDTSLEELHRKIEELEKNGKKDAGNPKS